MLGSMGTKGGTMLYHIEYGGYGTILGSPTISNVIGQPKCWLIDVGEVIVSTFYLGSWRHVVLIITFKFL
jgi:hypothetical protein